MQTEQPTQYQARKAQVNKAVRKAPNSFLKKILSKPRGWDADIQIAAYFELKNREVIA